MTFDTGDTGKPLEILLRVSRSEDAEESARTIAKLRSEIERLENAQRSILVLHAENDRYYNDLEEAYRRMRYAGMDIHGIPTFDAMMRRESGKKMLKRGIER